MGDRIDPEGAGSALHGGASAAAKTPPLLGVTLTPKGAPLTRLPLQALFPGLAPTSTRLALQNHDLHTPRWILLHFPACQLPGRASAAGASMCSYTWRACDLLTSMLRHRIPLPLMSLQNSYGLLAIPGLVPLGTDLGGRMWCAMPAV